MEILTAIWTVTYGVLLVILGLNAVIIVHELGHFLVARWCGVRVEKFYIWFDFWGLKFFKFKWGETEYGLGLFPLGGYVKMLGQEDNPGAIQAEIERAKLQNEDSPENKDDTAPPDIAVFAHDSYLSKTVPQRLAIIVAGVAMNFLFAIVCAAGAYLVGVQERVLGVGNLIAGSPAWEAGLQPGDKITAIDGKIAREFGDVRKKMIEGTRTIQLTVERQSETLTIDVSPRKRKEELFPSIGILSLPTLELFHRQQLGHCEQYYPAETLDVLRKVTELNPMFLEKVDGQNVSNYIEYQKAQLKKIGLPIVCTFSGEDVVIPAIPMRAVPLRFTMGKIVSVQSGSDAQRQGIQEEDTIVSVDGNADFDPLRLPQIMLRKVNEEQKTVELVIRKADSGEEQTLVLELLPTRVLLDFGTESIRDALGCAALGLAWNVEPVIAAVDESQLLPGQPVPAIGDRLVGVELVNCEPRLLTKNSFSTRQSNGLSIHSIGKKIDVPYIFTFLLQRAPAREPKKDEEQQPLGLRLIVESPEDNAAGRTKIIEVPILEADDWFQSERGFNLKPELIEYRANGIGEALILGTAKTVEYTFLVYQSVNSLINGTVSPKALNGPVGIVEFLYKIALVGWSEYLILLCLIGANLAVINLLPIPPLDGGHVLFLLYEGIFRRPPNELIQVILSYAGLFLIILLMVWTVSLDLACITRW